VTLLARIRRWLHLSVDAGAQTDVIMERVITEAGLRLADARGEIQLCMGQESRLATLRAEEERRAARALEAARRALAANRTSPAREAAARHVRARQLSAMYGAQLAQLHDSRRRLEALAETMALKLAVLEHQQQLLQARQQLARARQSLVKGLRDGTQNGQMEMLEEQLLTDELAAEAYQELMQDDLHPTALSVGDPVEAVLARLRGEMPRLPGATDAGEQEDAAA
jgi:phage shock protein A